MNRTNKHMISAKMIRDEKLWSLRSNFNDALRIIRLTEGERDGLKDCFENVVDLVLEISDQLSKHEK